MQYDLDEYFDEDLGPDDTTTDEIKTEEKESEYAFNYRTFAAKSVNGQPCIQVAVGHLPETINAINNALVDPNNGIFQRNGQLVRVGNISGKGDLVFIPFGNYDLQVFLSRIIRWAKWDGRKSMCVNIDCPIEIATSYLSLKGGWSVPHVHAIVSAPTMREDGSILDQPGLDRATGIYLDTRGVEFPKVPDRPTRQDGFDALAKLKDLVREVPFVVNEDGAQVSRSVFLSAVLTAAIRPSLPAAPLHAFNAPTPGTGKSMLQETILILLTGEKPTHITAQKDEEELEKKLGAELRKNGAYLSIDNATIPLDGSLFCQLLTQAWVNIRILGKSESFTVKNTAMFVANGNNLTVKADMVRRVLRSTINADCESPETREFDSERPDVLAMRNRPELVVAALTALKAFIVAGQPGQTPPLGSFEQWSRLVRDALIWYGEPDPVVSIEETRAEDPERAKIATLCREWWRVITDKKVRVAEVIEAALKQVQDTAAGHGTAPYKLANRDFKEALVAVADNGIGQIDKQSVGNWLGKHKNQIVEGYKIVPAGKSNGYPRWQVVNLNPPEPEEAPDGRWIRDIFA